MFTFRGNPQAKGVGKINGNVIRSVIWELQRIPPSAAKAFLGFRKTMEMNLWNIPKGFLLEPVEEMKKLKKTRDDLLPELHSTGHQENQALTGPLKGQPNAKVKKGALSRNYLNVN